MYEVRGERGEELRVKSEKLRVRSDVEGRRG